jgi:hypothetical protein
MSAVPSQFDKAYRRSLQMALNEKTKSRLATDGAFGPKSIAVLKQFQQQSNILVTGMYDAATHALLEGFIASKYLTEQDYVNAAKALGCEVAAIKAVVQVEAAGDGFLPDGRAQILFERHKFYGELLKMVNTTTFTRQHLSDLVAKYPNVINPATKGYMSGEKEYDRLNAAIEATKDLPGAAEAAMRSCSWGMFQIMGFNHKLAGWPDVLQMVSAMQQSERAQLDGFIHFVKADSRLINAIRQKDWRAFASAYNGSGYAANKYDVKMADAYKLFAK